MAYRLANLMHRKIRFYATMHLIEIIKHIRVLMRVCGVELKGGEAIICLLGYEAGIFSVPECRTRMFAVGNSVESDAIRDFNFTFAKLMEDYKVDEVVIIERDQKGKHMGSATSYKLEAAIQLIKIPVSIMHSSQIKERIKRNPIQADLDELELKKFQYPAFKVAYAYHHQVIYGVMEPEAE